MQHVFFCHETSSYGTSWNTKGPIYVFQCYGGGMHDNFAVSRKLNYNEASKPVLGTKMLISHYSKCIRHTPSKQTFMCQETSSAIKKLIKKSGSQKLLWNNFSNLSWGPVACYWYFLFKKLQLRLNALSWMQRGLSCPESPTAINLGLKSYKINIHLW